MARVTITQWVHKQLLLAAEHWDCCVDATAGKGNDTLFLCKNSKPIGKIFAFDIQPQAIEATEELLKKHDIVVKNDTKVEQSSQNEKDAEQQVKAHLILDGHENMDQYIEAETVDVIMFNLGYLPGGDHAVATKSKTTISAIQKGLFLLKSGGIMSICIYSGGDSGFEERDSVLDFLKTLDDKLYTVIVSGFYNKPNNPPIPVLIMKR